ncbi:hypothetical protein RRG08_008338 [Elysia crispata]|uniref:Uncharacterized protein n=1 Tax=Elysia crispata TaxID=231223 RepID=A0AAE0XU50_9GAST|nr:hypothetical protein RRG08_008338 [Elysia crispata]
MQFRHSAKGAFSTRRIELEFYKVDKTGQSLINVDVHNSDFQVK